MTKFWVIRAGRGGEHLEAFLSKNIASIGWGAVGSLQTYDSREALTSKVLECWPEYKTNQARVVASHLFRFSHEIQIRDNVLTYDRATRVHWLGVVNGPYSYVAGAPEGHCHVLPVSWDKKIDRDSLSVATRNRLGSIATLFVVDPSAAQEVVAVAEGGSLGKDEEDEEVGDEELLFEDVQNRAREFIKDRLSKLSWDDMQEVVAGLLRAMGYKTRVSPQGADRGKDILASPDGFGFEQPRIFVEVKHRQSSMGAPEIRSFLGGRHKDDKGLYVSTGGFTKEAIYEAERASIPVTLMDLDGLVDGLLERYESLDPDVRSRIPLKRLYWPA